MNREKALSYRKKILKESIRQKNLVETLPENTLVLLTCILYSTNRDWVDGKIACFTTNVWNLTSIQCHMVACDTHNWECDHDMQVLRDLEESHDAIDNPAFGRHPIKFQYIKDWEPLAPECVPLLVGYPIKYPRFDNLLTLLKAS